MSNTAGSAAEVPERIKLALGVDPLLCIEMRRLLSDQAAKLREDMAPLRALYRGGTASPYDQERKRLLSEIAENLRVEFTDRGEKVSEKQLESMAHASSEYGQWLRERRQETVRLEKMEAVLYGIEADIEEWDRLLDLARTMIHWSSSEMKHLT